MAVLIPPVLRSGLLQGVGATAGVLLGVVLARRLGPEGSGYVVGYRNIADLMATLGVLGLPQAFVFFVTSNAVSVRGVAVLSLRASGVIAGGVIIGLLAYVGLSSIVDWSLVWIILGGTGMFAFLFARGVLLGHSISLSFDLLSMLPNVLALLLCALWQRAEAATFVQCLAFAYAASGGCALILLLRVAASGGRDEREQTQVGWVQMWSMAAYGVWAWIPQISGLAAVFLTYQALGFSGDRDFAVGLFSCALVIYNVVQGPLALFVPALMRHWSGKVSGGDRSAHEYQLAAWVGNVVLMAAGVTFCLFGSTLISAIFGKAFIGAWAATGWLLLAALAGYHVRLLSSMLYAFGRPRAVAAGFAVRFVLIATSIPLLDAIDWTSAPTLMAMIWAASDWCCCVVLGICLHRVGKISWRGMAGLHRPRWKKATLS